MGIYEIPIQVSNPIVKLLLGNCCWEICGAGFLVYHNGFAIEVAVGPTQGEPQWRFVDFEDLWIPVMAMMLM